MQIKDGNLLFSPSDLTNYLESPYASAMERLKLADPTIAALMDPEDEMLKRLQQKGDEHEKAVDQALRDDGLDVLEVKRTNNLDWMAEKTIEAMKNGQEVIVQGYLKDGMFAGFSDYLVKVPGESNLGDWHYEVWDSKLAKRVKPYFIIQICCYIDMLEKIQGVRPKELAVKLGNGDTERMPVANYYAYYQCLKKRFLEFHETFDGERPDPAVSKAWGRWSDLAGKELLERDHLSQVANIGAQQIKNLEKAGIHTMQALAETDLDRIPNMADATFARAKTQARLQVASKGKDKPDVLVLPHDGEVVKGLRLLPPHSDLDVFFDIEGYPHVDGGLEYLWGNTYFADDGERTFIDFWAHDAETEKGAFEDFIDWVYARWERDPTMHIYHYANYEIAAIRKLMGRWGTREEQVDTLLRNKVFVDLYKVVSGGLMIGADSYSIKSVELLYRGKRDTEVGNGADSIIVYEDWREDPDGDTWQTSKVLNDIRDYNIDDCDSTQELTDWLRSIQQDNGIAYEFVDDEVKLVDAEEENETTRLRDTLLADAESERDQDGERAHLIETLAWSLEFHRRALKPDWWQYFERLNMSEFELFDDLECLAMMARTDTPPFKIKRSFGYEYSVDPEQEFKGKAGGFVTQNEIKFQIEDYNSRSNLVMIKTTKTAVPDELTLIPGVNQAAMQLAPAVFEVIEDLHESGFPECAITDFLMRLRPRILGKGVGPVMTGDGEILDEVIDTALNLDNSTLCIQGPPGAGKTFTAKHVIGELMRQGKRVGISSNSHEAILNLMEGVAEYCLEDGIEGHFTKIGGDDNRDVFEFSNVSWVSTASKATFGLPANCYSGTAWAFCHESAKDQFDYLFIDEAGQVSVANLIGMSRSTSNIILMGDQMQLGQPVQGTHPGESGLSILDYLLRDKAIIPDDLGIFLPITYRCHPDVTKLISDQVYEGRLHAADSAARHVISATGPLVTKNSGIQFVPVAHTGNSQGSDEEVAAIVDLVNELIGIEYWSEKDGGEHRRLDLEDILFVAPYNMQVNKLKAALGDSARVGTVDKFQGKEAPVVIMSMCASDGSESPRGLEFLFEKNRLNVALSRAQALAIVVGNPALANTPVTKPEQMELINFYCEIISSGR